MESTLNDLLEGVSFEAFFLTFLGLLYLTFFVIQIVLCWATQRIAAGVPLQFREVEPKLVWLLLIPCVPLVWNFFVFPKIASGYQRAFHATGHPKSDDCGEMLAFCYCLSGCFCVVPLLQYVAFPASYVLALILLIKLRGLKREAESLFVPGFSTTAPSAVPSKKVDPANPYA